MNDDDTEMLSVPREQFLRFFLAFVSEGDIRWECAEENREKIDHSDLVDPSKVTDVEVTDDYLMVFSEFDGSVTEKVARATHWQPAEYKKHDTPIIATFRMEWPDEGNLPETSVFVEQTEYPRARPDPDPHAI